MSGRFTDGERNSRDRRLWRLLPARLHPDAGGDHELFLFARDAMDKLCAPRRVSSGGGPGHTFSDWRGGMTSWASQNREGLRKPRAPRRGR